MPAFRLPVRQLVEFLLRTGSIDSRFTGFDRANEGARIHRKLQKAAGEATPPKSSSPANGRRRASPSPSKAGPTASSPTRRA